MPDGLITGEITAGSLNRIGRPYRDAQDRLLWKDKTCPART